MSSSVMPKSDLDMYKLLIQLCISTLLLGIIVQFFNVKIANHFKWLDIPSARRRHPSPTPVTGGVGVIITWFLGLIIFYFIEPNWITQHLPSIYIFAACTVALVILGLIDDLRGLSPFWKLLIQTLIASSVILFEPQIHDLCIHWSSLIGFLIWPLAILWIVGITNSINLIDGLDGLAGGTSFLVLSSITFLCLTVRNQNTEVTLVIVVPLIASILSFLRINWNKAKVFLGDNGSLPLGFLISITSLLCHPPSKSWIMIASIILMLGYPILDMGLAVLRRYRKHQPLFKADRNHLHYRIQRLGLDVRQTAILLLSIGLLLQFTSIGINFLPPSYAALGIVATLCSIMTMLHLIYSIEADRVNKIFDSLRNRKEKPLGISSITYPVIHIEIDTLLEAGLLEELKRYQGLIDSLYALIGSIIRREDLLFFSDHEISIVLISSQDQADINAVTNRLKTKISGFLELYELQCSLASIPIRTDRISTVLSEGILNFKDGKSTFHLKKAG